MNKQKNILLVPGWYAPRLHLGISDYAEEHGWYVSCNLAYERVIPYGWDGDGVLAWLGEGDDLAEFVQSLGKPTVDFSIRRPHLNFPRVLQDHAHAARLVAEQFLSRGFKNFLFYSDTDNWSYEERGHGFVKALEKAGHTCDWIRWHNIGPGSHGKWEWSRRRRWLVNQMRKIPKPLAVFAANDQMAVDVLEASEKAGFSVPEQIAIVGAENYLLGVDGMRVPISSVDTNLEEQGYEGAALLDRLMRGEDPPTEPIRVPAARVITRKSSDILAVSHPGVARGLRFIWENFRGPLSVGEIAESAGMSRRGIHQAFVEHLARTPGEEILSVRIEYAKTVLADTDEKVDAIARLCGYQNANTFSIAFRKNVGMAPGAYRRSIRPTV
jgi:LacI family transcriptional regulator